MFRQSVYVGIDYLLKLSIGVILLLYLSRMAEPALFGEFLLIISAVNIYQTIGRSGSESHVLSEVNKFPDKTIEIILNTFVSSVLIFVFFAIPLSLMGEHIFQIFSSSSTIALLITIGLFHVYSIFDATLQAHNKGHLVIFIRLIATIFSFPLKIYAAQKHSTDIFLLSYLLEAILIFCTLLMYLIYYQLVSFDKSYLNKVQIYFSLKNGFYLCVTALTGILASRLDQFVLASQLTMDQVAFYLATMKLIDIIVIPFLVLFYAYTNFLSKLSQNEIMNKFFYSLFALSLFGLIVILIVNLFSTEIIQLILGEKFVNSSDILKIIIINVPFLLINGFGFRLAVRFNQNQVYTIKSFCQLMFFVTIGIFFIKNYGVQGAIYVTLFMNIIFTTFSLSVLYMKISSERE